MKNVKGFTLIELLIVVAIIAILAAIAVPNFLEAQVRARVSRVQSDMRTIGTAIESYRVDWNAVPYQNSFSVIATRTRYEPGPLWTLLSTPIAYLNSALLDAFVAVGTHSQSSHPAGDGNLLDPFIQVTVGYIGPTSSGAARTEWAAASYGPDCADDTNLFSSYPYTRYALPYDPTNGTVSWGDIYRHGGKMPSNFVIGNWNGGGHGSAANDNSNRDVDPYAWTH